VTDCLFCDRAASRILGDSTSWYVRCDNYPASPGHVELVTKRHVESFFDLNGSESAELFGVMLYARRLVADYLGAAPEGWTIGVNEGLVAGRSIHHLHVHMIPRESGDVPDPRGGIRQVVPNYNPDQWV
jgi:diadenosine tetraphosphate (Ap4A) HIT family hydrolase